jgi:pimeloyl-ACP methyl ester carboxylesterase/tellurite resistance protein
MLTEVYAKWVTELSAYGVDAAQRAVLFTDIIRKRGNVYLDHLRAGQPPVLVFDYETIMDGRTLERPANYALVRIIDRRQKNAPQKGKPPRVKTDGGSERRHQTRIAAEAPKAISRPIVIFDPRAGHGPGIGGSKTDSQIGMALDAGHPVYFLIFFTEPVHGQTLADVCNAQIKFIEKVRELHPEAPRPAIIGNCQGGWAAALVGAERPDLVGPMVFNGSPLSYWGGVEGINPMRYLGGLMGGTWISSFLSDLGHGYFDGANIVANFENLNPANTLWSKLYNVYAKVDTEEKRFLDFEKWWGGFFLMTDREIHKIVEGLFVGNKLERGEFELETGRKVNLKNNDNPVVVFASFGDNITPPQQAFNWIVKTYGTVEEIKRRGQVIVYIDHSEIGHLGIFVSAKIARKEHKEIIASFDMLNYLPPGLYEMQIEEDSDSPGEYSVRYVEKNVDDILALDDGFEDEKAFLAVRQISEAADLVYRHFVSPWIRMGNNHWFAEAMRQLHPLRTQRYMFSDINPWLMPFKFWAEYIKSDDHRRPVPADNHLSVWEKSISDVTVAWLNRYREARDTASELMFQTLYESPGMQMLSDLSGSVAPRDDRLLEDKRRRDAERWRKHMATGEFADAMVRIFLAIGFADKVVRPEGYRVISRLFAQSPRMMDLEPEDLQQIVREQSRMVQTDADEAISALPLLLARKKDRRDALKMLDQAAQAIARKLEPQEQAVRERVKTVLQQ